MPKPFHSIKRGHVNQCIIRSFADGDTVTVSVRCHCSETWHIAKVRIANIESWELNSPDAEKARNAKTLLELKFMGKRGELFASKMNSDSFGRVVGDVQIEGVLLSEFILNTGLGWIHPKLSKQK